MLALFRSPGEVRIVTTNFDRHFSTVAAELYKDGVEIYYAPALPLGREFNGLVYLHGSVDKEPEHLVLTDSNFGRAYLTDGWATRFLQEMFATYTVLFVGYSHDDPVMRYLARGLVPETSRYALTEPGQDEHWRFLDITPITYPVNDGPNRHIALGEAVDAWVKLSKMGALAHERDIRQIVELTPPIDQKTASYIEHALEDIVAVRFFTRHARILEWLHWAESKQAFRSLFQTGERVDEVATEMAVWFAQNFVCDYPDDALALVQRQGQRLNPILWRAIARELAIRAPRSDVGPLAKWVTVLLSSAQPDWRPDFLNYLLEDCRYPEDRITALLLFEHLTRPHLELKPYFSFAIEESTTAERVDVAMSVEGDEHCLKECWEKIFQPNLSHFAGKLEPILTSHLIQAHLQLRAFGKANERWDLLSFHRSAIEPHEQDRHPRELDTLVDAARDVIEWMLEHEPDRAHAVIEAWSASGVPLLRRLAIHGITESLQIDLDEKIAWVLDRDLLYTPGLKHEIFRLLERVYPHTTEPIRVRLLERANRGPLGQAAENLEEMTREYEIFNLLVWLRRVAPDCPLAEEHFKAIQDAHPDFGPREHPDFDSWMSIGWVGPQSPLTVDELLAKRPHEEIEWLLTYQGDKFMGPDREGLLATITEAVAQSFEWGWQLVVLLQEKEDWSSDVWGSVFRGWQEASLTENQWTEVLTLLADHTQLYGFAHPIADLLEKGMGKEQDGLPLSCLSLAERLANQLWDASAKEPREEEIESEDWLASAINHPGGKIAEFWLHALSKRRAEAREGWAGLPVRYKQYFEKVLSGESYTAQLGRVVLASQTHFLFALDADWTRENILPLLDWSRDQRRAQQAWHGFLAWGRWNEALLPELLPLYEQTFPKLSTELSIRHDQFCRHLASIAVYSSSNPMKDGWLRSFLLEADPESHKSWATNVGHQLRSLNEESIQDLWDRWMDDYWTQRNTGVPLPLSEDEKEVMVLWAIPLEPVFPAVVEKICAIPVPSLKHTTFLYDELAEKELAPRHPISLTRLLRHLLKNADEPFHHCREVEELVGSLMGAAAPHRELLLVCEDLARLGCPNAAKPKGLVEGSNNS